MPPESKQPIQEPAPKATGKTSAKADAAPKTTDPKAEETQPQTSHAPADTAPAISSGHTSEDIIGAFKKGGADATAAVERNLPVIKKSISKATYMFCYYLSFGAVYTAEMVMAALPDDSAIRNGFKDGASAGKKSFADSKAARDYPALEGALA